MYLAQLLFNSMLKPSQGKWTFVSEGRKHYAGMLADSGLLKEMGNFAFSPAGQPMCVYGDPAYPLRVHLQAPYRQGRLTQQ